MPIRRHASLLALLLLAFAACTSARTSASASSDHTPALVADTTAAGNLTANVAFLQGMIHHHAQALRMVAMMPSRTQREAMRLLGERIAVSQRDEIASMRRWLQQRGEYAPAVDSSGTHVHADHGAAGHHGAMAPGGMDHDSMPGMLSEAQMAQLAAASGAEFERLFLEFMIAHHEGALVMVRQLFGAQGAAQEPELFGMANEIDADQRAEIARMRAMLAALPPG